MKNRYDRSLSLLMIMAALFTFTASLDGECTPEDGKCKGIRGKCPVITDTNCNPLPGTLWWVKVTSFGNYDVCNTNGTYDDGKQCCIDPELSRECAQANFYVSGSDCFAGLVGNC